MCCFTFCTFLLASPTRRCFRGQVSSPLLVMPPVRRSQCVDTRRRGRVEFHFAPPFGRYAGSLRLHNPCEPAHPPFMNTTPTAPGAATFLLNWLAYDHHGRQYYHSIWSIHPGRCPIYYFLFVPRNCSPPISLTKSRTNSRSSSGVKSKRCW
jgi:hypothetical protein